MPEPPGRVELEAAPILLGVDHEHPTGPDHQVIEEASGIAPDAGIEAVKPLLSGLRRALVR
jgi:hypothetical protein